jgi:hypothetical protein
VYPDDSFFEDTKEFEEALTFMKSRIPEERITVLGQDPKLEMLEWQKQCFKAGSSKEKDGEIDKEKQKNKDPSNKEKNLPKETSLPEPKDLEVGKEIRLGIDPKTTSNTRFRKKDPKES